MNCAVCGQPLHPYGAGRYRGTQGSVDTAFSWCPACDVFYRHVTADQIADHMRSAPYTAPDLEPVFRRRRTPFLRGLLQRARAWVGPGPKTLLDVGAAHGHLLALAPDLGFTPMGVELLPDLQHRIRHHLGVPCYGSLDEVTGPFDVITFIDSFYYFDHPDRVLAQAARLLPPSGLLVMRLINRNWLVRAVNSGRRQGRRCDLGLDGTVLWSRRGITRLLQAHGLQVVEVRYREPAKPLAHWRERVAYALLLGISLLTRPFGLSVTPGMIIYARRQA